MNNRETVTSFYAALNANDIQGVLKLAHPGILRIEFEGTPVEGRYQGIEAFRKHVETARSTWAEGSCTPGELTVTGETVIVSVHVRVRLKDKTDWVEGNVTDGFRVVDGKIIEFRSFMARPDALLWAGNP